MMWCFSLSLEKFILALATLCRVMLGTPVGEEEKGALAPLAFALVEAYQQDKADADVHPMAMGVRRMVQKGRSRREMVELVTTIKPDWAVKRAEDFVKDVCSAYEDELRVGDETLREWEARR